MLGIPNVSLAREASRAEVYLVVGDTKFWIEGPTEFDRLGFQWPKVRVVDDGALAHLVQKPLHAPPAIRASDAHFSPPCGQDYDSVKGRMHLNCKPASSIIRRDVLIAGWLGEPFVPETAEPAAFVNVLTYGVEDVHYYVRLDAVFLDRMYGPNGLSTALRDARYPGNPADPSTSMPFADGPPGSPVTFNSWTLPFIEGSCLKAELNAWHVEEEGTFLSRWFVGRGPAPAGWVNPLAESSNAWFPFHPLEPEGIGMRLHSDDYVVLRGTLWQDSWHDMVDCRRSGPTANHAWLEMHPPDWIVRVRGPSPNARLTTYRVADCQTSDQGEKVVTRQEVGPDFLPSSPTRQIIVRSIQQLIDQRTPALTIPGTYAPPVWDLLPEGVSDPDRIAVSYRVTPTGTSQGRFKASWLVGWREVDVNDRVWVDEGLPKGAQPAGSGGEGWEWVPSSTPPGSYRGNLAHRSILAAGVHQHYFTGAPPFPVGEGHTLFTMVYLDPDNPPEEVMLQWESGSGDWRRAYWGADRIPWGTSGTVQRRPMGRMPFAGEWVRLGVPVSMVGLAGRTLTGMAFTLYGGRATWDYAGVRAAVSPLQAWMNPPTVQAEIRSFVTARAIDAETGVSVAGRVFLQGQDVAATNTRFNVLLPAATYPVVVRCPGYPDAQTSLEVAEI